MKCVFNRGFSLQKESKRFVSVITTAYIDSATSFETPSSRQPQTSRQREQITVAAKEIEL